MVVKMAKMMKSRRLRKRVRKTLGALFLASAIAVAAIPVDGLQASTPDGVLGVTIKGKTGGTTDATDGIPFVKNTEPIYVDGVYQFAYVNVGESTNKVAVILGYNSSGHTLEGGKLTIPDTLNVYDKFTDVQGSTDGYVAVGQQLNFLFYERTVHKRDPQTNELLYKEVKEIKDHYVLLDGRKIMIEDYLANPSAYPGRETEKVQATDAEGNPRYDDKGNPVMEELMDKDINGNPIPVYKVVQQEVTIKGDPIMQKEYLPCYYNTRNAEDGWGHFEKDQLYTRIDSTKYDKTDAGNFRGVNKDEQWITGVAVEYIGNQVLKKVTKDQKEVITDSDGNMKEITYTVDGYVAGDWITPAKVASGEHKGVFAQTGAIVELEIGSNLKGIGDYAFYFCTGLKTIDLSRNRQLGVIGNHAFDSCLYIEKINVPSNCNMIWIGDHAFYKCQNLQSFSVPVSVQKIGDGAFEDCQALTTVEMFNAVDTIGDHAFKDCVSLTSLTIPQNVVGNLGYNEDHPNYGNKLSLNMVEGCKALKSITVRNSNADFAESKDKDKKVTYGFDDFIKEMPATFYFEGVDTANGSDTAKKDTLHYTANENSIAFKYLNDDTYEIVKKQIDGENVYRAIYRVNSQNTLKYCHIDQGMSDIDMPSTIGPYKIVTIGADSFQYNCFIQKVKIPASVRTIADNAFLGCHNLTDVIFEEPVQCEIGNNAFKTQEAINHRPGCNGELLPEEKLRLTFTGPISYESGPFKYAMNPKNNVNSGTQSRAYIKYYSGWPTNLTVQYNETTGKNELVDYPTFSGISEYDTNSYPYMTKDYVEAAGKAVDAYKDAKGDLTKLTDYQRQIINSALNISLPQGIESVKDGLFVEKEKEETSDVNKTLTTNGIAEILPNTFEGFKNLKSVFINGATSSIGDYAFKDCTKLDTVEISPNVNSLGVRPFAGCTSLTDVSFQGGDNFVCDEAIIFGLNNGEKNTVVQCLETRGNKKGATSIKAEELAGVTGLAKEAFYDCAGLGSVDLKGSSIDKVPEGAFAASAGNKSTVYSIYLPKTCKQIQNEAFKNSAVRYVEIPGSVSYIDLNAFNTDKNSPNKDVNPIWEDPHSIDFYCEPDSAANIYASNHSNINISDKPVEREWEVTFWVTDRGVEGAVPRILDEPQIVKDGEDAVPPEVPEYEGYKFLYWSPDYHGVGKNLDVTAVYEYIDPDTTKLEVTFLDHDDTVLKVDRVFPGDDAVPPAPDPVREGYRFTGWRPAFTNITTDMVTYAQYEKIDSEEFKYNVTFLDYDDTVLKVDRVTPGEDAQPPLPPSREDYTFLGWRPDYTNVTEDRTIYAQYEKMDSDDFRHVVTFLDYNDEVLKVERVSEGNDAQPPTEPTREGYRFTGWRPDYRNITENVMIYAQYEKVDSDELKHNVVFVDYDEEVLKVDRVSTGQDAQPPLPPSREGYIFSGWRPDYKNVTEDLRIYAQYEKVDSEDTKFVVRFIDFDDNVLSTQRVIPGEDAIEPKDPTREGYRFTGWRPAITNIQKNLDTYAQYEQTGGGTQTPPDSPEPTATPAPGSTATPAPGPTATPAPGEPTPTPVPFYTLTVRNGSGSGSYIAGAQVIVIADNPDSNSEFSHWTIDPGTAVVASKDTIGTILTMPACNVTMTANYKARVNNGNGNTSTNTVTRPSGGSSGGNTGTSSNGSSNGTTVVINKNGLSNTGVVSVTVNGSSDNFVVKISEDANATEAVLRALMGQYSDMSKIAYFPMDISLYDSTGTAKITDTTGLAVNITLPIPDSLIPYAGNNKVAGVVNGQLDKLAPKFTTISGVPCISFTATHFSPYVIYVDTSNLSEASIRDNTPKTGDGIHPKWFLAMGLACISFVLFIKKDKKAVPVKVAAR